MPGEEMEDNRNSILVKDFAAKYVQKTKKYRITRGNSEFVSVYDKKLSKNKILHLTLKG